VQREFLSVGMDLNAALASLDLTVLLSDAGRGAELKSLAVELHAAFEARDIHREATAVLILFERACEEERMTAELVRGILVIDGTSFTKTDGGRRLMTPVG
jgi:hypothetical protein